MNHDLFEELILSDRTSEENIALINIEDYYPKNYRGKKLFLFWRKTRYSDPNIITRLNNQEAIFLNLG